MRFNTTNVPAQSLTLLNDPFVHDQARVWGNHLTETVPGTDEKLEFIYWRAFSRAPDGTELENARGLLEQLARGYGQTLAQMENDPKLWTDYCHSIFNLKEFIHLL